MTLREWTILAMTGLCVGCGGEDKTEEPAPAPAPKGAGTLALDGYKPASLTASGDADTWAVMVSTPVIYLNSNLVLSQPPLMEGNPDRDTSCPVKTQEGTSVKYTGGCTDKAGWKWFGTLTQATVVVNGVAAIQIRHEGFGYEKPVKCEDNTAGLFKVLFNGEQTRSQSGSEAADFTLNLHVESSGLDESDCTTGSNDLAWEYRGSLQGSQSPTDGKSVWNGSGRVGNAKQGVVTVETKDEVIDSSVCSHEASSGSTTLQAGDHRAVLQYDGAVDCQETSTVKWSVDGAAPITLEGVSCSAATGAALPFWGVLGAMGWLRRRVRRST